MHSHSHDHPPHPPACGACCGATASTPPTSTAPASTQARRYRIASMDCAVEEAEIRHALKALPDIRALHFDLGARVLAIEASSAVEQQALRAIRRLGFDPQALDALSEGASAAAAAEGRSRLVRLVLALLLAVAAEGLSFFLPQDLLLGRYAGMALAAAAIGLAGLGTYKKGLAALRVARLNINALMTVAVTGAFLIGQWPEAAMVMALYAIAELIEARAVDRARNAIQSLLALAPEDAEIRQADGSWQRRPVSAAALGDLVRLRPGERVPLDGRVSSGQGTVDESAVTGESLPVDKAPGDALFAGTINQTAALEFRVGALAAHSTLARIIHAVEQAQATRAPTQAFVERFAAVYTPAVFLLALALALLAPLLLGWPWLEAGYKALVLLVIACPCALVISTPVTLVSGLAAAARRGILIKGGIYLEQARRLKLVALDKTGTVTAGQPKLVSFQPLDRTAASSETAGLARIARSLAQRSDHPVSQALAAGLVDQAAATEVQDFSAVPGCGVQARVDGQLYRLGKAGWIPGADSERLAHEQAGQTVSLLADAQGRVLALFAVADTIKPGSAAAVAQLHALGVKTVMLSGDNTATARAIAAQAGIDEARGQLLPEDKLEAISDLQARHGPTAMVGDGINDAPALARADIGFAMGGMGSDTAMEAADIVIMNDDLGRLAQTIRLSRRAHAVLLQNIALALGIKAVFLVAAVFGQASMWMAVFADMGASLLVVFNGLRLLRVRL